MFNFYLIIQVWKICESYFEASFLSAKQYRFWIIISFFYIVSFLLYNIDMMQMTIFLLWATLLSLRLAEKKHYILAGAILALAINIKVMPLVFVPYLLYRNYWKTALTTVLLFLLFLIIPSIFIGIDYNNFLLASWWRSINPSNSAHLLEVDKGLHSIVSTIPVFLTDVPYELHIKRNFANLDVALAERISNIVRLFFIVLTVYFLQTLPFKSSKSRMHTLWECSYLLLITPLIFPHQNKYSYYYLLPAFMYLIYFLMIAYKAGSFGKYKPWLVFLLVISFVYTPIIGRDIVGSWLFDLIQYFRVQVICTMLLVLPLAVLTPKKLDNLLGSLAKTG